MTDSLWDVSRCEDCGIPIDRHGGEMTPVDDDTQECPAGMRCNLCGFTVPSPDLVSVALMQQHLWQEHGVERFRPLPRTPKCAEEPW